MSTFITSAWQPEHLGNPIFGNFVFGSLEKAKDATTAFFVDDGSKDTLESNIADGAITFREIKVVNESR